MNRPKNPFVISGVIILFIATVSFYWFEWRPLEIRKTCHEEALKGAGKAESGLQELYEFGYKLCLREKGF